MRGRSMSAGNSACILPQRLRLRCLLSETSAGEICAKQLRITHTMCRVWTLLERKAHEHLLVRSSTIRNNREELVAYRSTYSSRAARLGIAACSLALASTLSAGVAAAAPLTIAAPAGPTGLDPTTSSNGVPSVWFPNLSYAALI